MKQWDASMYDVHSCVCEKMGIKLFWEHQMSGAVNTMRNRNEISVLVTCVSGLTQLTNAFSLLHCLSLLPQLFLGHNNSNKKGCEYCLAHILYF